MATILPFKPGAQTRSRSNMDGPAAIVFFPGVRYERSPENTVEDPETPAAQPDGERPVRSKH